jgi:D-glycero-alpha-D-manno-heptose-7-phosphate kinase
MASDITTPGIVVTRTPLRISFAGGGTDLPSFYRQDHGAVLSTTIDKYLYVTVKRHGDIFNEKFRLNYFETENVTTIPEIKNDIARECLRLLEVEPSIYVSTVADLPANSGLGSSSSFAVGLLHALHALRGERTSPGQLAEEAAHIEIDVLKRPIGKQDHYAAAFGGFNYFTFLSDDRVTIEAQHLSNNGLDCLFDQIMLFSTGIWRDASTILTAQNNNLDDNMKGLVSARSQAQELRDMLSNGGSDKMGAILDEGWKLKRQFASTVSNSRIDQWYDQAITAGASGGKVCGAGGGGFLMFLADPTNHEAIRRTLSEITSVPVGYEAHGSRVILED